MFFPFFRYWGWFVGRKITSFLQSPSIFVQIFVLSLCKAAEETAKRARTAKVELTKLFVKNTCKPEETLSRDKVLSEKEQEKVDMKSEGQKTKEKEEAKKEKEKEKRS